MEHCRALKQDLGTPFPACSNFRKEISARIPWGQRCKEGAGDPEAKLHGMAATPPPLLASGPRGGQTQCSQKLSWPGTQPLEPSLRTTSVPGCLSLGCLFVIRLRFSLRRLVSVEEQQDLTNIRSAEWWATTPVCSGWGLWAPCAK